MSDDVTIIMMKVMTDNCSYYIIWGRRRKLFFLKKFNIDGLVMADILI